MYRIALCDDEQIFSEEHKNLCTVILQKNKIEHHIDVFGSGDAFLGSKKYYDLILLDIVMEGMSGMDIAAEIRKHDSEIEIIFITSSNKYALQGYDVNALHYLLKPVNAKVLERLILSDYHKKYQSEFLVFKSGTQNLKIPVKDIIRAETVGRRVAVTLTDSVVYFPGKLTQLLNELPGEQFIRCHQAFIINLHNTRELTRQSAFAVNGTQTPVSRTYTKDVQKAFLKYIRNS
jgi:DNA-binding LytR/AlgR family response regulator